VSLYRETQAVHVTMSLYRPKRITYYATINKDST